MLQLGGFELGDDRPLLGAVQTLRRAEGDRFSLADLGPTLEIELEHDSLWHVTRLEVVKCPRPLGLPALTRQFDAVVMIGSAGEITQGAGVGIVGLHA